MSKIIGSMGRPKYLDIQNRQVHYSPPFQLKKPIHQESRKQELIQQVIGNQQILRRINDQKTSYDRKQYESQRMQNEHYIANISEFPFKKYSPHKTLT